MSGKTKAGQTRKSNNNSRLGVVRCTLYSVVNELSDCEQDGECVFWGLCVWVGGYPADTVASDCGDCELQ